MRFQPRFTIHFPQTSHTDKDVPFYTGKIIDGPVFYTKGWMDAVLARDYNESYYFDMIITDHFPEPTPDIVLNGSVRDDTNDLPF